MKKLLFAGIAVATLSAVPALAIQQGGADRPPVSRAAMQSKIEAKFAGIDANRDGFVDQAEAAAAAKARRETRRADRLNRRFAALDLNRDGAISRAEFEAGHQQMAERRRARITEMRSEGAGTMMRRHRMMRHAAMMRGGMGMRWFERVDADKDGRVSLAEASAAALLRFDRIDADHNGTITPEERNAARHLLRPDRPGRTG